MREQEANFTITREELLNLDDAEKIEFIGSPISELSEKFSQTVFGQERACEALAQTVIRSEAGLIDPNRPRGVFMFLGPTGVGKTELGKTLAKNLFTDEWKDRFIRIDCTEYQDYPSVNRLRGSDPDYLGYGDNNIIITPETIEDGAVIVFDEIEKAHSNLWKWLMPILEEGETTVYLPEKIEGEEKKGKKGERKQTKVQPTKLNFRNTFIVFTSNEGVERMQQIRKNGSQMMGFSGSKNEKITPHDITKEILKNGKFKYFPEFLGRIDTIIGFNDLESKHYEQILNKLLFELNSTQHQKKNSKANLIVITQELGQHILGHASTSEFGGREVRNAFNSILVSKAAEYIAGGAIHPGQHVVGDIEEGEVIFFTNSNHLSVTDKEYDGFLPEHEEELYALQEQLESKS